jgi:hypothetical protein
MKKSCMFGRILRPCCIALLATAALNAHSQSTISGLMVMGTDGSGNWNGTTRWNTIGGDSIASFYIVGSSNFSDPFINGPNDAQAAVSIPLSPGLHTFTMFAAGGSSNAHHGLNIFFNGNNTSPGISVFGMTQESATPPYPVFGANGAANSQALNGQTVPAANSLTFVDSMSIVTLTDYRFAAMPVYNQDRVGFVPFGSTFVGSDGRLDWVGQFTVSVTAVPEPSTSLMFLAGALGLAFVMKRKRNSN